MNIRFLDVASQELDDAIVFYDREREGLGDDFRLEVKYALNSIAVFPEAWPRYPGEPGVAGCGDFLMG